MMILKQPSHNLDLVHCCTFIELKYFPGIFRTKRTKRKQSEQDLDLDRTIKTRKLLSRRDSEEEFMFLILRVLNRSSLTLSAICDQCYD